MHIYILIIKLLLIFENLTDGANSAIIFEIF